MNLEWGTRPLRVRAPGDRQDYDLRFYGLTFPGGRKHPHGAWSLGVLVVRKVGGEGADQP